MSFLPISHVVMNMSSCGRKMKNSCQEKMSITGFSCLTGLICEQCLVNTEPAAKHRSKHQQDQLWKPLCPTGC